MAFALSDHLSADVALFVEHVMADWGLTRLREVAVTTTVELVTWATSHGPSSVLRVVVTWDEPLVHLEVFDRGALVPDPNVSRADATLAVRLLIPPGVEWGAGLDSRGRCLWATLRTQLDTEAPAIPSEAGP